MRRYSFWITSALGACALIWLIADWSGMTMVQRLPVMYIAALSVHEIEELKLPGGFVELVTAMTGVEIKNIGACQVRPAAVHAVRHRGARVSDRVCVAGDGDAVHRLHRGVCPSGRRGSEP
jgi:hypothetical protein